MLGIGNQNADIRVPYVRCHLGPNETEIRRHENRAESRARKQCDQEHRLVQPEEGDPIAPFHSEPVQASGELLD
jgi:hypothetical protein